MPGRAVAPGGMLLVAAALTAAMGSAQETLPDLSWSVPFVSQGQAGANLRCGGAAVAMVRHFYGDSQAGPRDLDDRIQPDLGGVTTEDLVSDLEARGYPVESITGGATELQAQTTSGYPVLALIAVGGGRFHYVVVTGLRGTRVNFHDPVLGPRRVESLDRFLVRWGASGQWAVAVGEPDRLPEPSPDTTAFRRLSPEPEDAAIEAYLEGRQGRALELFEEAGGLRVTRVEIEGARAVPHDVLAGLAGLQTGDEFGTAQAGRAQTGLSRLPSAAGARLDYIPRAGGRVELRGYVTEGPVLPSPLALGAAGLQAAAQREFALSARPGWLRRGERVELSARWDDGWEEVRIELSAATARAGFPAIWDFGAALQRRTLRVGPSAAEERVSLRHVGVGFADVAGAGLEWGLGAAVTRHGDGTDALADLEIKRSWLGGRVRMDAEGGMGTHAAGEEGAASSRASFATWAGEMRASTVGNHAAASPVRLSGRLGLAGASHDAPWWTWPSAGVGRGSSILLRAHPLLSGGAVRGDRALGRRLAHASVEVEAPALQVAGLVGLAPAAFVDHARASQGFQESPLSAVDAGVGLRVRGPFGLVVRMDLAWGLTDPGRAWSVGLER